MSNLTKSYIYNFWWYLFLNIIKRSNRCKIIYMPPYNNLHSHTQHTAETLQPHIRTAVRSNANVCGVLRTMAAAASGITQ